MVLPRGLNPTPEWAELVDTLERWWDADQRVRVLGHRNTGPGTDVELRFLASEATRYVRVHVQSDKGNDQGGSDYDPDNSVSSTRIDCRNNRQQDVTISRDGASHYYVWLIPVEDMPPGSNSGFRKYDGEEQADQMAFVDLGT